MQPSVTAIGWYREEDYAELRKLFVDGANLPATYAEWLRAAESGERRLTAGGHRVIRAELRPRSFADWCRLAGRVPNASARMEYSNDFARRIATGEGTPPAPVSVTYPDGSEELGILTGPGQLELGARAHLLLEMSDVLVVAGERRPVHGITKKLGRPDHPVAQGPGWELTTIIRLGPALPQR